MSIEALLTIIVTALAGLVATIVGIEWKFRREKQAANPPAKKAKSPPLEPPEPTVALKEPAAAGPALSKLPPSAIDVSEQFRPNKTPPDAIKPKFHS